jgi:hypothetical protein
VRFPCENDRAMDWRMYEIPQPSPGCPGAERQSGQRNDTADAHNGV